MADWSGGIGAALTGQLAQEVVLVHAIFESFAAINEDDGDFITELAAQAVVGVHVHFAPGEAATAMELGESFLDDFAEMAALAGIDDHFGRLRHERSLAVIFRQE